MVETPELKELIQGIKVAADKIDDLRDMKAAGKNIGIATLFAVVLESNTDLLRAFDGSEKLRGEIDALKADRESVGEISKHIGLVVWDILEDLRDPNS